MVLAETKAETKAEKKAVAKKEPSPAQKAQQDKFRDCAKKWSEVKKEKGVKGRKAYRAHMSECLKGSATKKEEKKEEKKKEEKKKKAA
jgi:hypothetical protein